MRSNLMRRSHACVVRKHDEKFNFPIAFGQNLLQKTRRIFTKEVGTLNGTLFRNAISDNFR